MSTTECLSIGVSYYVLVGIFEFPVVEFAPVERLPFLVERTETNIGFLEIGGYFTPNEFNGWLSKKPGSSIWSSRELFVKVSISKARFDGNALVWLKTFFTALVPCLLNVAFD